MGGRATGENMVQSEDRGYQETRALCEGMGLYRNSIKLLNDAKQRSN